MGQGFPRRSGDAATHAAFGKIFALGHRPCVVRVWGRDRSFFRGADADFLKQIATALLRGEFYLRIDETWGRITCSTEDAAGLGEFIGTGCCGDIDGLISPGARTPRTVTAADCPERRQPKRPRRGMCLRARRH